MENKIQELLKSKWRLENDNIRSFQKINELKRKRLTNIKNIDMIENDLRKQHDFVKIRRSEIR